MAWTETCKIDFNKQVEHKKAEGMPVREALKVLSEESGIPIGTLSNWFYERQRAKPIDISDFFVNEVWKDIREGNPVKWEELYNSVDFRFHNLMLWLWLETEYVFNWYRAAFNYYGKSARITDGWRVGVIRCDCPKCNGKVHHFGQLHNKPGYKDFNYSPELMRILTKKGYVNFNAL
jgi:hypothetical protein